MATKTFQLSEIFQFLPKSHRKAGDGLGAGLYPFFTSSQLQTKWFDKADYSSEAIILGTGGAPSIYCADNFSTSADTFIIAPKDKNVLAKYVYYFLSGNMDILDRGFKGAGLRHLSKEYTEKIQIPFPVDKQGNPNLAEQKRIVATLEEAASLKKKRAEADQKMNELIPALFVQMFGDSSSWKTRWGTKPLEDLIEMVSGGTPTTTNDAYWSKTGIPWVSAKDMKRDFIADSQDHITSEALSQGHIKLIPAGSVLVVVRGMILAHTLPISLSTVELTINQDLKALIPKKVNGVFLWSALQSSRGQLLTRVKTAAHGTKKLDTNDLIHVEILAPDMELQNQFAEKVKEIEAQKGRQKQSAIQMDALFSSLLSRVFSSKLPR